MKILLILIATISIARANLIDLTPGGFDLTQPFPTVVADFFARYGHGMENLAGANLVNGQWVWSPFTPYGADRFNLTLNASGTGADLDWNLLGTPFHGLFVFVESSELLGNLYLMPWTEWLNGSGFIEIDGSIPPSAVTVTGRIGVPDTGSTLALMGLGLLGMFFYGRRIHC